MKSQIVSRAVNVLLPIAFLFCPACAANKEPVTPPISAVWRETAAENIFRGHENRFYGNVCAPKDVSNAYTNSSAPNLTFQIEETDRPVRIDIHAFKPVGNHSDTVLDLTVNQNSEMKAGLYVIPLSKLNVQLQPRVLYVWSVRALGTSDQPSTRPSNPATSWGVIEFDPNAAPANCFVDNLSVIRDQITKNLGNRDALAELQKLCQSENLTFIPLSALTAPEVSVVQSTP